MRDISVETPTGHSWVTLRAGHEERDEEAHRAKEREHAVRECQRLAGTLQATDPVRAQRLAEAAADARKEARELYGLIKDDGRPSGPNDNPGNGAPSGVNTNPRRESAKTNQ